MLVHSPLLGLSTWRWVAAALRRQGHEVVVPDLRAAVCTGDPDEVLEVAASAAPGAPCVLVGHSGAGWLLPSIGSALTVPPAPLVFVDAGIPPCEGRSTVSADFLPQLRRLARGGALPRWSEWWGADVLAELVPDPERRRMIIGELPEVPLAFFEAAIDLPRGWCDGPACFVQLSDSYRAETERARSHGWTVVDRSGGHLAIVSDPEALAVLVSDVR